MTSEVLLMNLEAVVMGADSAVTISRAESKAHEAENDGGTDAAVMLARLPRHVTMGLLQGRGANAAVQLTRVVSDTKIRSIHVQVPKSQATINR